MAKPLKEMMAFLGGEWKLRDEITIKKIACFVWDENGPRLYFTDGTSTSLDSAKWKHILGDLKPGEFWLSDDDGNGCALDGEYWGENFLTDEGG